MLEFPCALNQLPAIYNWNLQSRQKKVRRLNRVVGADELFVFVRLLKADMVDKEKLGTCFVET